MALVRLGQGNTSNAKCGWRECWNTGSIGGRLPVYFGRDGEVLVILLTGGTKQRQQRDIAQAKELWADYKRRRKPLSR